jgi:amino acid adenylation domain-containing protein
VGTSSDHTLYQWFSNSVERVPNAVAVEVGDHSLSYAQLSDLANSLAGMLLDAHGAIPQRIALLASRSVVAFAGYLAALRLGAAVIPVNPGFPAARNQALFAQLPVDVLLVDKSGVRVLDADMTDMVDAVVCRTDDELLSMREPEARQLPPYRGDLMDVAYVLFTSGSTGRPKGVPITHRNASAYVAHNIARYGIEPGDRVSNTFDLTFDPSVFDLFVTWGGGATLVCPRRNNLLTPVDYLVDRRITHWFSVPSVVSVSADLGNLPTGRHTDLRRSIFIGEQLTYHQARAWQAVAPNSTIDNVYGPTELTVACTEYRLPVADWPSTPNDTVPIGPVYDFLDHVIVDENGRPAQEGELCVRGSQRFTGYLDPSDNDGRFLVESGDRLVPYTGNSERVPPECYYRTGDRVLRTVHRGGHLVHLGRLDHQVKVLGYRVELGEIETVLARHPEINQAVVVSVPGKDPTELNGFYTGTPVAERDLVRWMRGHLPAQVVPRRLVHVKALPLNANGKIDRGALRGLSPVS